MPVIPKIRPVPVTWQYRRSVAIAAVVTVLIPFLYAGLVVALAAAMWMIASSAVEMLSPWPYLQALALVCGGLGWCGAGLVLFLLARVPFVTRLDSPERSAVDLEANPALRDLIHRVCAAASVRPPSAVAVDLTFNASAGLERPILGLLFNRYRLTLGLPLLAVVDRQVLAHVIAHEVGHFAQPGALRILHSVHWAHAFLDRMVHSRDDWDVWVADRSGASLYGVVVRRIAAGGLWLSRGALRALLRLSQAASGQMSREMEFHADLYAVRVAGTPAFLRATEDMAAGGHATAMAAEVFDHAALIGPVPSDFPALAAAYFSQLDAAARAEILRQTRYTLGVGADSHPDNVDRMYRADIENADGVLAEEGSAASLFGDFGGLCRQETLQILGGGRTLIDTAEFLELKKRRDTADAARVEFFGRVYELGLGVRFPEAPSPEGDWESVIERGKAGVERSNESAVPLGISCGRWFTLRCVVARLDACLEVDWMELGQEPCDLAAARGRMYQAERDLLELRHELGAAMHPIVTRLMFAHERRDVLEPEASERLAWAVEGLRALEALDECTTLIVAEVAVAEHLVGLIGAYLQDPEFLRVLESEYRGMVRSAEEIAALLDETPFSVDGKTLRDYAMPDKFDPGDGMRGFRACVGATLPRLGALRLRLMGEAAQLATQVESLAARPNP
ncbi:MAG: hypothetical protein FJW30_19535 [Acidobacteria bacterium]|nr:hypothetical protein [Acidobacteriota bacterium]